MPAPSHPASHPNQDSYGYGDSESNQRAVLELAGHPVQSVVAELGAELGGFVAETRGLVAGQAPAAAKAIDDFGHGRDDGVTDMIAGRPFVRFAQARSQGRVSGPRWRRRWWRMQMNDGETWNVSSGGAM
jgi:hypothetical protein